MSTSNIPTVYDSEDEEVFRALEIPVLSQLNQIGLDSNYIAKPEVPKIIKQQKVEQTIGFVPTELEAVFALPLLAGSLYQAIYDHVINFITTNNVDYQANNNEIYASFFDACRAVSMKLEFVEIKKQKYIQAHRVHGDAFLLNNFFNQLTCHLQENGFAESEEEEDSDYDLNWDEEFDYENDLSMTLNLSLQPEVVSVWCDDLVNGDVKDITATLNVMTGNVTDENVEVLKPYTTELLHALFGLLTNYQNNLTVIRAVSNILAAFAQFGLMKLNEEQVLCLADTLAQWSMEKEFSFSKLIMTSEEVQKSLAKTLNLSGQPCKKLQIDVLQKIAANSANDIVQKNLSKFISTAF